jgi:putative spermidine/putrescine transport system substrate-binding protein
VRRPSIPFARTAAVIVMLSAAACGAPNSGGSAKSLAQPASPPPLPKSPVTLNVVDVAGDLQESQGMIEDFVRANPKLVSHVNFTTATAPELPSKLKAEQNAGRLDIDLVLTGNDALAGGIQQNLWVKLFPNYQSVLPDLNTQYLPGAKKFWAIAKGDAIVDDYGDFGPLLEYLPGKPGNVPATAADLMNWAKSHPGKFMYARPANSGPGRAFVQSLPYMLGDSNPQDPVHGWTKTWAYLKELSQYVSYYPSHTSEVMKDLANGTVDLVATTTGWDINPRSLGTVPQNAQVATLKNTQWIIDGSYVAIPRGVSAGKLAVDLALMKWMLKPNEQARAYDDGYMYPGPAVQGVTLSMAPAHSQQVIAKYGRPDYDQIISRFPQVTPLDNQALVTMFDMWDREIGGGKVK